MDKFKYLYRAFRYRFRVDPTEINYLRQSLQAGETAVDIGAHKGAYLYWMYRQVQPAGRVFGFEPQPTLFGYLTRIQEQFRMTDVQLEQVALSDHQGTGSLFIPAPAGGTSPGATLEATPQTANAGQLTEVSVNTLDQYFDSYNQPIHFIKIDAEGHELAILKGGVQLLEAHHPRLLIECEARHLTDHQVQDVFDWLLSRGYTGTFIQGRQRYPLSEFKLADHQQRIGDRFWEAPNYVNNFIFEAA